MTTHRGGDRHYEVKKMSWSPDSKFHEPVGSTDRAGRILVAEMRSQNSSLATELWRSSLQSGSWGRSTWRLLLSYRFSKISCARVGQLVVYGRASREGKEGDNCCWRTPHTHTVGAGRPGGSRVAKVFDPRCDVTWTCQAPNRVDHAPALDQLVEKGEEVHDT